MQAQGGWQVMLDTRPIRTAAGNPQVLPTRALAEALATEWSTQGDEIDANAFPLRDLADYAIDAIAPDPAQAAHELLAYAETDTLCYRGDDGSALHRRQDELWEPLLRDAEARLRVRFVRVAGVLPAPQPAPTLDALRANLATQGPFRLAALKMLASLAASLVIALAALERDADPVALWNAANLEEDWQAELWGQDATAEDARAARFDAFQLAMRFARLSAPA